MIPIAGEESLEFSQAQELDMEAEPSKTYQIKGNRIIGNCDGLDALKQAVYKILQTERFDYPIYDWDYGIELKDLYGQPISLLLPELKRNIIEALKQDDRIESVDDFSYSIQKRKLVMYFTVHSFLGDFTEKREVSV